MFSVDLHYAVSLIGSICTKGSTKKNLINQLQKHTSLTVDESNQIIDILIQGKKLVRSNSGFSIAV